MRWRLTALCAVSLVGLLGCPETYGIGGTVDQAVHEDMMEALPQQEAPCPPAARVKEICEGRSSKECLPECKR